MQYGLVAEDWKLCNYEITSSLRSRYKLYAMLMIGAHGYSGFLQFVDATTVRREVMREVGRYANQA